MALAENTWEEFEQTTATTFYASNVTSGDNRGDLIIEVFTEPATTIIKIAAGSQIKLSDILDKAWVLNCMYIRRMVKAGYMTLQVET